MLCISRKRFIKSLKFLCQKDLTLNATLKKYYKLKNILKSSQKNFQDSATTGHFEDLVWVINTYIKDNFTLNECFLLLAIFADNKKICKALNYELSGQDAGLNCILCEEFLS